jgi:general L-amino acid transport system substrate-binding protein
MRQVATLAMALGMMAGLCQPAGAASATLDAIKGRDKLICGANGSRPGFSSLDSKGEWQGLDVDTCKAVAAAVLGDSGKTQFVKVTSQTRFLALQTSEVDLLTANVTWTLKRDAELGVDFTATTFYDGQGFMVAKKSGVKTVKDLGGATVCVLPGSTSEKIAADVFRTNGLEYKPVVIQDQKELDTAFFGGRCDAHVQSTSGLSSTRATVAPNPDDFIILPGVYGKDPMGPVVRQGDAQWRDIVVWSVFAMMQAEELGIASSSRSAITVRCSTAIWVLARRSSWNAD